MSESIECPNCGAPAKGVPADPRVALRCRYCGVSYHRERAEEVAEGLRQDVAAWLSRTTGRDGSRGAEAVDEATRSYLFNDRILPGLRRDARQALDEGIGDVEGAPLLVPPVLHHLSGFRGHDATLVTRRNEVLGLRRLLARLNADDVAAFARSAADQIALGWIRASCERTMRMSNVACALASGVRAGSEVADANLAELEAEELSAAAAAVDPQAAVSVRASQARATALRALLRSLAQSPPSPQSMDAAAQHLESTSAWLLSPETRSLRGALASTGIDRDALAIHLLAAIARAVRGTPLPLDAVVDGLAHLAPLLGRVTRPRDAAPIVHSWALALAARKHGAAVPLFSDMTWVEPLVRAHGDGAALGRAAYFAVPYWVFPLRHTRAEGTFLVSGKQRAGFVFVPASASPEGMLLGDRDLPWVDTCLRAIERPAPTDLPLDLAVMGPEGSRVAARSILGQRGLKNVTLGDARLVYMPLCVAELVGPAGRGTLPLVPSGRAPHVQVELLVRLEMFEHVLATSH